MSATLCDQFRDEVVAPLQQTFVGKDEIIDVLAVGLVGGENVFLLGPPGTAKSALVQELGRRLGGRVFDYLLTRFTEPNELFGPFDIRRLREGELVTNTEGMLPEADLVFLDELLNANSAILNSLLLALNERIFRRGRETRPLPTLMVVGASNQLPQEEALAALFDRFLLRVPCNNVSQEQLVEVLRAGWELDVRRHKSSTNSSEFNGIETVRGLQHAARQVDLGPVRSVYLELIHRLRHAGFAVSDRRAVKFQKLLAASAVLSGRSVAQASDMWVLRYTWDLEEQQEVLRSLVQASLDEHGKEDTQRHPRSSDVTEVDPELLARDLGRLYQRLQSPLSENERTYVRDQLNQLAGRCEWVRQEPQASALKRQVKQMWDKLG
jgi:MoxR-like ATPase